MDGNIPVTPAPIGAASDEGPDLGNFIGKEKAEVYLLMDFLSGRANTSIRDEKIITPGVAPPAVGSPMPIIEKYLIDAVCDVRWPSTDKKNESNTASILLKARDRLSELANPASGASIAFTTFVTNDMASTLRKGKPIQEEVKQRAILANARLAYPDYESLSRSFNIRRTVLGLALPICLAVTLVASFYVAFSVPICAKDSVHCNDTVPKLILTFQSNGLPACYGLVGALAGVLRGIQTKIRDVTLMPRDRMSIIIQLWLGIVMGTTIGIFPITSTGSMAPSALAFVAGLGVDSVFLWLESLIKTIFGNKTPNAA